MPSTPPDPGTPLAASRLLASLWRTSRVLNDHLDPILKDGCDLDRRDFMVLNAIHAGARFPSHVAERLRMPRDMTSRVLHGLIDAGLVARAIDDADSRRSRLTLTVQGEERRVAVRATLERTIDKVLTNMGDEERERLLVSLDDLTRLLAEELGEPRDDGRQP